MTGPPPDSWAVDPDLASAREVVPGIWRLRLPLPWPGLDHVNAYVVERDDGVMLVDCGSGGDPSCLVALERALAQTGHAMADVRVLTLTHAHSDHSGLTRSVLRTSGAELWAHPNLGHFYDVLRDPEGVRAARERRARLEGVPSTRLAAYADVREELDGVDGPIVPDHPIADCVRIPSALGAWDVVETPGHAPSHVSLVQRERGLIIAGDLVCFAFVPYMDYGASPDPYGESLRSLQRLSDQPDITLALPGHGRPLTNVTRVVDEHRLGFEARRQAVADALALEVTTAYELCERVHGTEDDIAAVGHLGEILAILRNMRLRRDVIRTIVGGVHYYRLQT